MPGAMATPDEALTLLDADAVRRWAVLIRAGFAERRAEIDALNVFPVPDGDTGTNLFLTFDGALDRNQSLAPVLAPGAEGVEPGAGDLLVSFASALLWAARGNSGVILSQLARGIADAARGHREIDAATLAVGLQRADEMAWKAVTDPKDGTILSVSRAAAVAAVDAAPRGLHAVAASAFAAGAEALARTPQQLKVLADAGVVDAGGAGYVVLLECLERVCAGDEGISVTERWGERWGHRTDRPRGPERRSRSDSRQPRMQATGPDARGSDTSGTGDAGPSYEVMYLLADSSDERVEALRDRLVELGDSVLVVGGDGEWNIHAHVDDAGAAVEAGIVAGRPHRVRITGLEHVEHVGHEHVGHAAGHEVGDNDDRALAVQPPDPKVRPAGSAIVACVAGDGLISLFREVGAMVVTSAPSRRASTGQIIEAIRAQHAAGAAGVIVLPSDGDTELAARAAVRAASDEGIEAHVVRARAAVQSVAALAVFEQIDSAATNVLAMQSASAATRHGAVTTATRSALTSVGPCEPGDVLGIIDGDIVVVGHDLQQVAGLVVDRLIASGGELLTLVTGTGATDQLAEAVSREARAAHLGLDVTLIDGGQPVYSLLLGVE
ncbi:DAK2 domain fusion protein YloV [Humibacillus sp. DSM 29435]|uniref:DAK2 domain-containing protein n=1 Tax=Humibacillus sp. DSM 29435 TaxID=1869167 RepID=UPI000872FAA3|nr:DAK2 domain-containing protein [Humibacillus sp. DSM 29435]OFE16694.1 DAK2 domain fusion protein YloV [Humibacillus sp. DSM 29435]